MTEQRSAIEIILGIVLFPIMLIIGLIVGTIIAYDFYDSQFDKKKIKQKRIKKDF